MSRRRSSSMCCNRLIEPNWRCSFSTSGSTAVLGIVIPWDVLDTVAKAAQGGGNGIRVIGGRQNVTGRGANILGVLLNGLCVLFQFQFMNLVMNLALKFVAGALEFGNEFAHRPGNLRQPLWTEQNQAQEHQKRYF